jgi:zinc protease
MTRTAQFAALALAAAASGLGLAAPPVARNHRNLKFPPLREVKIPQVAAYTLPNGLRLYLLEDHELPLIHGSALIRTGSLFDPAAKTGLAALAGVVMRSGGTQSLTGDQLDERLENVAASVESSVGETNGSVTFNCLKDNLNDVLQLFRGVLVEPAFRQDKIDLARQQTRSAILRRNDDPGSLGGREFSRIIYGPDTPYGRRVELATINAITRDDLAAFHKRYYFPGNVMLALSGDFSTADMKSRLESLFGSWKNDQPPVPKFPEVTAKPAPAVYVATKPDVTQTFFFAGQLGGTLKDKDFTALEVMGDILGGGFSSRLFRKVRTQLGLAYNVSADWSAAFLYPGIFEINGSTQSKSTTEALQAIFDEVNRIRESEVTDDELQTAKDTVLNSFVFNFDKPSKTLSRLVTYEYYGYPKDFIEQYQKAIAAVTRADILRVARARLAPENFTIVAVGNPAEFGKPLTALMRRVEKIDLTIPEPAAAPDAAPAKTDAASMEQGRRWLDRARQALGGAAALAAVKDYTTVSQLTITTAGGSMKASQTTRVIPAARMLRQDQQLPFGKIVAFYDGTTGWIFGPQGQAAMPEAVLKQVRTELFRGLIALLGPAGADNKVTAEGDNRIRISDVQGNVITLELDPQSGLPARELYSGISAAGPTRVVESYSDWKEVAGGIRLPYRMTIEQDGKKFAESEIGEWKLNTGLKPEDLAQKPQ